MATFKDFAVTHADKLITAIHEDIDTAKHNYPLSVGASGLSMVREMIAEGKMIRGLLLLLSIQMHGGTIRPEHYHLAGAIELLHGGFLIHDDIMDQDYRRRNQDSIYYRYIKEGRERRATSAKHYGASMAMCLGDMVFFLVFEIIAKRVTDPEKIQCIVAYIGQEVQHVGPAQMMDAAYGQIPHDPTPEEIDQIYTYKTAHYTFSLPLILGAVFGKNLNEPLLKEIGRDMGIIFQLVDDDLGMFGSSASIGKEVGSDVRENKKTLLRHLLLERADASSREKLLAIFGNPQVTTSEIEYVKKSIEELKVRSDIFAEITKRRSRAEASIGSLPPSLRDTDLLSDLLSYIIERTH